VLGPPLLLLLCRLLQARCCAAPCFFQRLRLSWLLLQAGHQILLQTASWHHCSQLLLMDAAGSCRLPRPLLLLLLP
jgi:hypothetical protein